MSPITIIKTVVYALGLPVIVEFQRFYYKFWDILIRFQNRLIELATKYLWPWVAELLKLINFESIKELYNDIYAGIELPEKCISKYISRSGTFEYLFIILVSILSFASIVRLIILPLETCLLSALIIKQFEEKYPTTFRIIYYPSVIGLVYSLYMVIIGILYVTGVKTGVKRASI